MVSMDSRPFNNPDNTRILNAIRKASGSEYQKRIPAATKANIQDVIHNLFSWKPGMNEFLDGFVNRIGMEIARDQSWNNPLAKFKIGMLDYGDTIEEYMAGLLKATRYDPDRQELEKEIFGAEKPDVAVAYHKVNRQDKYKLTINQPLLRRAFNNEQGLSKFITSLMAMPEKSDNWDEFLLMSSLFSEYDRAGGFFKVNVPDLSAIDSDGDDARYALRRMREMAGNLGFIDTLYNAAGMPVAANPDELELFITPEANATLDVEALAGTFNIDRAKFDTRTTIIPQKHFGIPGAQAILTTRDFFVVADQLLETTVAENPVGLHTNYWLHHWQVVSASPFVPAIVFTTEPGTVIEIQDTPVTDVVTPMVYNNLDEAVDEVERGSLYFVSSEAVTTPADGPNDAVRYAVVGEQSVRTYITQSGMLHVAIDEAATSIFVDVYAVDDDVPQLTKRITVPVVGDKAVLWPNPRVEVDNDDDGLFEVTPENLTVDADDQVTIPDVRGVQYKKAGVNVSNGSVHTLTASTVFTAEARSGSELAPGATASWTLAP